MAASKESVNSSGKASANADVKNTQEVEYDWRNGTTKSRQN